MSKKDEALKLALELKNSASAYWTEKEILIIEKLIKLLAQPKQPAHPVVPDAIHHTDLSESLEYIQGWNDCRAAMFEGKENT